MCEENRRCLFFLLAGLLLSFVAGVLRAEEPGPWYLISAQELRSIEEYKTKSEAEKLNWLSWLQKSETTANSFLSKSKTLSDQLAAQQERNRELAILYEKSETEKLTLLSLKNGEIAGLEKNLANEQVAREKEQGKAWTRLIMVIALAGTWIVFIGIKICRFFRLIPF